MKFGEQNLGPLDRGLRAALGILILITFAGKSPLTTTMDPYSMLAIVVSVALIMTAALGSCGIYTVLGISTISCCKPSASRPAKAAAKRKGKRRRRK